MELKELAAAYASVNAKIEELTEVKESIKQQIIDAAGDFGTYEVGGLKVVVRHNRRLDPARFIAAYPPALHPSWFKATPDTTAIKQHLAPDVLDSFYNEGAPAVVVS